MGNKTRQSNTCGLTSAEIANASAELGLEAPRVKLSDVQLMARQLGVCVVVEAVSAGEPRWLVVAPENRPPFGTAGKPMGNIEACELAYGLSERFHPGVEYYVEMEWVVGGAS
jgi:hypothetical protein